MTVEKVDLGELARRERDEAREEYLRVCRRRGSDVTTAVRGEAWRSFQEAEARYQKRKAALR